MKYDILLFDADNTILDFNKSEEHALSLAFESNGLRLDDHILQVYRRNNIKQWELFEQGKIEKSQVLVKRFVETFRELGISADIESVSELYEQHLHNGFYVIEHAREVLDALQPKCRLYLVSNGVLSIQNSRMKGSGMDKYFIKRFVSEEIGCPKPNIGYFNACFAQIENFDRSRALIIGDSLTSDIQGGVNAGIDTCWFNPFGAKNTSPLRPTYVIDDLRKLVSIVS